MNNSRNNSRINVVKITQLSAGTEPTSNVFLRPPLDRNWRVIRAVGFHNDTTARVTHWGYFQQNQSSMFTETDVAAEAASVRKPLGLAGDGDIILRFNTYARFTVDSITSGKTATIAAIVEEFDGEND